MLKKDRYTVSVFFKSRFQLVLLLLLIFSQHFHFAFAEQSESTNLKGKNRQIDITDLDESKGAWWYGGQAQEEYDSRRYNDAIINFSKAILLDSEIAEFYYYRANAYAFINEPDNALSDFKKALELNPDYISSLNNLGWTFVKNREYIASLRYFFNYLKALVKDPKKIFGVNLNTDFLDLINNLGWEALRNEQLPNAIRYFNNNLKLAPRDADAYLGLSLVYYVYGDLVNAELYLDKAKVVEPALYQGISGLAKLEKSGYIYTPGDKKLLTALYEKVGNAEHDLQKLTSTGIWKFLLGFMYLVLGIIALVIFILRIKRNEGYILILAILNLLFGFELLYDNPLIQLSVLATLNFWIYIMPVINAAIPIAFILFIRYFIGWGWRKSILLLFLYSIFQGVVRVIAEYSAPAQDIYGTTNIIFGWLAVLVLFLHLFLPEMRKNREVQIIGAGLGFYLIAILFENLVRMRWFSDKISFDEPAYLFFNVCLVYVAVRRIANTERDFLLVRQDLETARNIQNGILPGLNPKDDAYEVSSAYIPMALIGGDYFDYQMPDKNYIGVLIADVSGHGISAALIASMLKVAFTSQLSNAKQPATVLQQMNRSLSGQLNNEFITAGYFGIDLSTKTLSYSSAGHPPLIHYRRNTDALTEIKVKGIPIGVYGDAVYNETNIDLLKGDRLIFYTDGILDIFNPANEAFGRIRLIEALRETKNYLSDDVIKILLEKLRKWSGKEEDATYDDDITLIIFDVL